MMNRTWSLPHNSHGLVGRETRGWIITMLCDECSDRISKDGCEGTGKGCSDSHPVGAMQRC